MSRRRLAQSLELAEARLRAAQAAYLELSDSADTARVLDTGIARRAAQAAGEEQYKLGFADGLLRRKRGEHELVAGVRLETHRWHICCRACRLTGHRRGCADCRTRAASTFGRPAPGDYQGGPVSWS